MGWLIDLENPNSVYQKKKKKVLHRIDRKRIFLRAMTGFLKVG